MMVRRVLVSCCTLLCLIFCGLPRPASAGKPGADTEQPRIQISSPADGQRTTAAALEIAGTATDNVGIASATLSLDGAPPVALALDRKGNFHTTATLPTGPTALVVKATDRAGNVASVSLTVYYDPSALEILSPADGATIDSGWINLQGRKAETIVGVAAGTTMAEVTAETFIFERVQLDAGLNTLKVTGVDAAGNLSEDSVQVTCTSTLEPFAFAAVPPAGSPPFTATFSWVQNTAGAVSSHEIDPEGTGVFVPAPDGIAGLTHTFAAAGEYYPTVRTVMADGLRHTNYLTLSVYPPARFVASFPASEPAALAVDAQGRLFVLERGADRVRVFDSSGVETAQFGSSGSEPGQFARPSGLSLDGTGNIYVADTGNHRVQKFSPTFEHLKTIGRQGTLLGGLDQPRAIAVDTGGNIFVTEGGNRRVQQFDRLGNSLRAWGSDVLADPWGISSFQAGKLAVADHGGGGLLLFSDSGTPAAWGDAPPALEGPAGVTNDPGRQEVAAADAAGNRMIVMSYAGTLMREASALEGDALGLLSPLAAVRRPHPTEAQYFVADTGHNRVVTIGFSDSGAAGPIEAAWSGMKSALFSGNVEGALLFFAEEAREQYRGIFAAVADQLDSAEQLAAGPILPLSIEKDQAEYGHFVLEEGTQVMYRVRFVRDGGGAWKILHW